MSDISNIKSGERKIDILHPATKEPIGLRIGLLSLDDDHMKKIKRKILDNRLHLEQRGKHFKADDIENNQNELMFAAMTGWEWYDPNGGDDRATYKGEALEFTKRNVFTVLDDLTWARDQVTEELGNTEAFFNASKSI